MNINENTTNEQKGLINLFLWLEKNKKNHITYTMKHGIIYLPAVLSNLFCIGVGKKSRYGQNMFIMYPSDQLWFLKDIRWEKLVLIEKDQYIYIIGNTQNNTYAADHNKFAIGIYCDHADKHSLLKLFCGKYIDGREYFIDGDSILINHHNTTFSIPVELKIEGSQIFTATIK